MRNIGLAEIITSRRLSTFVGENSYCLAACSTVFLPGYDRKADGRIEIAPLNFEGGNPADAEPLQMRILREADNPPEIIELVRSLNWNQSYIVDDAIPFERDLPGDAVSH